MLPNVSAIYRDLAFMADPKMQQRHAEPSFSQPAQSFFYQKQSRHNQLMEKLRNAQRESSSLNQQLRGVDSQYPSTSSRPASSPYETSYQRHDYNPSANFVVDQHTFTSGRGWKPPNIRYRHIEDQKQSQITQSKPDPITENRAKQRLERQFYENQQRQSAEQKRNSKAEAANGKKEEENMRMEEASDSSYGRSWANRQSKFEDKLESYYDLCRKRPISRKIESNEPELSNKAKFTRSGSNRPTGIELEKAIKMLTLD